MTQTTDRQSRSTSRLGVNRGVSTARGASTDRYCTEMVAPVARERLRISPRSAMLSVAVFGATLGVLALVAAAQRVIGWVLVAATLAGLLHPLASLLQRRMPRALATGVVMLALVGTLGAVGYGLVDDLQRQTRRLQQAGPERARQVEQSERFGELARDIKLAERTDRFLQQLPQRLQGGKPAEALRAAATRGVAFLATAVLTVFLLQHGPGLARAARNQVHDRARRERLETLSVAVYRRAFAYAQSSLAMSLAAGLAAYLAARLARVPGPAALGVWVGLWDLVPLAGALVGALPIVALAAVASGERAIVVALFVVAYQAVENLLVQRSVERSSVRVGPFVTLTAGLVGLELSGVAGALLAVLAATIAVTVADELADRPASAEPGYATRSSPPAGAGGTGPGLRPEPVDPEARPDGPGRTTG